MTDTEFMQASIVVAQCRSMKRCGRCGNTLSVVAFSVRRASKDGLAPTCKPCVSAYGKARALLKCDELRAKRKAWERLPDVKTRLVEYQRIYRQQHKDHLVEINRRWRARHHERILAKKAAYYSKPEIKNRNRSKGRAYYYAHKGTEELRLRLKRANQKRRALRKGARVGRVDHHEIYGRDRGSCHICERPVTFETTVFDHVIPLSKGGEHSNENIRVACRPCNQRKWALILTPELKDSIAREVRALT